MSKTRVFVGLLVVFGFAVASFIGTSDSANADQLSPKINVGPIVDLGDLAVIDDPCLTHVCPRPTTTSTTSTTTTTSTTSTTAATTTSATTTSTSSSSTTTTTSVVSSVPNPPCACAPAAQPVPSKPHFTG